MLENKTPDPNSQSFKVEDILAKAEEIRNARDRQSSVTNSDLGEAFKLFTVVDEESKVLTKKKESSKIAKLIWKVTGFGEKTLWDVIQIVAVPSALAVAGFWFQDFTKKQDVKLAESKTKQELQVADSKAKQETLTKYLDQMSDLLEKGLLKSKQDSPMFIIAQSKTVVALQSLDSERQRILVQFLQSANLNKLDGGKGLLSKSIMTKAQLPKVDLSRSGLSGSNLNRANLHEANLYEADLRGANLAGVNLSEANLYEADLRGADLRGADLRGAILSNAKLGGADLTDARLDKAYLDKADFSNALLIVTNFTDVNGLEKEQLERNNRPILCGTSLPEELTKINPGRDCDAIPKILLKRYPTQFKDLEEIKLLMQSDYFSSYFSDKDEEKEEESINN
jgi:uncharacterized protein YjbI with pentapeptide repeats